MGKDQEDVRGELKKLRLNKHGIAYEDTEYPVEEQVQGYIEITQIIKEQQARQTGCKLLGQIQIARVPGNFHISANAYADHLVQFTADGLDFDTSYQINHMSFGKDEDLRMIEAYFVPHLGLQNPLDGLVEYAEKDPEIGKYGFIQTNYYIVAVPAYYRDYDGREY